MTKEKDSDVTRKIRHKLLYDGDSFIPGSFVTLPQKIVDQLERDLNPSPFYEHVDVAEVEPAKEQAAKNNSNAASAGDGQKVDEPESDDKKDEGSEPGDDSKPDPGAEPGDDSKPDPSDKPGDDAATANAKPTGRKRTPKAAGTS